MAEQTNISRSEIINRFGYHKATSVTGVTHDIVRAKFIAFAVELDRVIPDGRPKMQAFNKLQEAAMWANFAVAENAPVVTPEPESIVTDLEDIR